MGLVNVGIQYLHLIIRIPPAVNNLTIDVTANPRNVWQIGNPQKIVFNNASSVPNVILTSIVLVINYLFFYFSKITRIFV